MGRILADDELDDAYHRRYTRFATACVLGSKTAVTARHCVDPHLADPFPDGTVWIELRGSPSTPDDADYRLFVPYTVAQGLPDLDVSLLRLHEKRRAILLHRPTRRAVDVGHWAVRRALHRRRLVLRSSTFPTRMSDVVIEGFPARLSDDAPPSPPDGTEMLGKIVAHDSSADRVQVLKVFADELGTAAPENPRGFSGGPVRARQSRRIVGIISAHRPEIERGTDPETDAPTDTGRGAAVGASLYATRAQDVLRRSPRLLGRTIAQPVVFAVAVVGAVVIASTGAQAALAPDAVPPLPTPAPGVITPATQLPGCQPVAGSVPDVDQREPMFATSTHGPGNALQIETSGWMEQPFAATAPYVTSVEVAAANNDPGGATMLFQLTDSTGRELWSSSATVDDSNSNLMVAADRQPDRLPLEAGRIYVLRVTNTSPRTIALFSHSLAADDFVTYGQPACTKRNDRERPRPAPNGQYLAARILGALR